jgi:hypothetical protein
MLASRNEIAIAKQRVMLDEILIHNTTWCDFFRVAITIGKQGD